MQNSSRIIINYDYNNFGFYNLKHNYITFKNDVYNALGL